MNANVNSTNEQLWSLRPVRWGLRMFGSEADDVHMANALRFKSGRRQVIKFLGLCVPDGEPETHNARLQNAIAARRLAIAELPDGDSILFRNLAQLGRSLGLSNIELDILALRAMASLEPSFVLLAEEFFDQCGEFVFRRLLADLLDAPNEAVDAALAASGNLVRKGLVMVSDCTIANFTDRLFLLRGLTTALVTPASSADQLFARMFPSRREPTLELSAYPHLAVEVALVCQRLEFGAEQHAKGVNVLLHGRPGTGKSELAAALAHASNRPLYVAPSTVNDFSPITPRERLSEIVQLQRLVNVAARGLILVDEAEDLFPVARSDSEKTPTKAAVNECLETNPVPTIWISNSTGHMDEAFLRRFDMVVHVPALPSGAKQKLLRESLPPKTLEECELRRYAAQPELSPAMITRLARVATSGMSDDPEAVRENLRVLSSHYLRTLGSMPVPTADTSATLDHDPDLLNTNPPLATVMETMAGSCFGARMLLHGVPGTGKSAFGKALAERLDKPLLQRPASSLLSMWVGGTEHNLREMFDEARRENGVLLLDEADSFLRGRDFAQRSWEVTQVNELLTQMEAFDGIFICTTNRLDDLDPAALRRFDFKVEFKPLCLEQRVRLIRKCCALLGLDDHVDEEQWAAGAQRLDGLTPGDAAAALRRLRFTAGAPGIATLLDALADECCYKPAVSKPIGFVH